MSFGYGVDECNTNVRLALEAVQNSRRACGEQDEFTRDIAGLHTVLQRMAHEAAKPDSLLNGQNDDHLEELGNITRECAELLKVINERLEEYNGLGDRKESFEKLWRSFRLGDLEMERMKDVRVRIAQYRESLNLYLNIISSVSKTQTAKVNGASNTNVHFSGNTNTGGIQFGFNSGTVNFNSIDSGTLRSLGGDVTEIRKEINWIIATMQATARIRSGGREASILSSHVGDDKGVWKKLRRELVKSGINSEVLHRNKKPIMDYLLELGNRGVLDEPTPEEDEVTPNRNKGTHLRTIQEEPSLVGVKEGGVATSDFNENESFDDTIIAVEQIGLEDSPSEPRHSSNDHSRDQQENISREILAITYAPIAPNDPLILTQGYDLLQYDTPGAFDCPLIFPADSIRSGKLLVGDLRFKIATNLKKDPRHIKLWFRQYKKNTSSGQSWWELTRLSRRRELFEGGEIELIHDHFTCSEYGVTSSCDNCPTIWVDVEEPSENVPVESKGTRPLPVSIEEIPDEALQSTGHISGGLAVDDEALNRHSETSDATGSSSKSVNDSGEESEAKEFGIGELDNKTRNDYPPAHPVRNTPLSREAMREEEYENFAEDSSSEDNETPISGDDSESIMLTKNYQGPPKNKFYMRLKIPTFPPYKGYLLGQHMPPVETQAGKNATIGLAFTLERILFDVGHRLLEAAGLYWEQHRDPGENSYIFRRRSHQKEEFLTELAESGRQLIENILWLKHVKKGFSHHSTMVAKAETILGRVSNDKRLSSISGPTSHVHPDDHYYVAFQFIHDFSPEYSALEPDLTLASWTTRTVSPITVSDFVRVARDWVNHFDIECAKTVPWQERMPTCKKARLDPNTLTWRVDLQGPEHPCYMDYMPSRPQPRRPRPAYGVWTDINNPPPFPPGDRRWETYPHPPPETSPNIPYNLYTPASYHADNDGPSVYPGQERYERGPRRFPAEAQYEPMSDQSFSEDYSNPTPRGQRRYAREERTRD
jgi:hypothetical protein